VSAAELLGDGAQQAVREAVAKVERQTAAEIVVAVRYRSGSYRHTDYLVGFGTSIAVLCALLFLPQSFDIVTWPLELSIAFLLGTFASGQLAWLRRWLTSGRLMDEQVTRSAKAAFVDLGVSRTRGRTGVLVYVSLLERRTVIVGDVALDAAAKDDGWIAARAALERAMRAPGVAALTKGIQGLAAPLARLLPRAADDVNELADDPRAA
jgi:putative membrane protein